MCSPRLTSGFKSNKINNAHKKNETTGRMRPCEVCCFKERDVIGLVNLSNPQMRQKQTNNKKRRIKPLQSSCSGSWSSRDESLRSAARLRLLAVHPPVTVHIKNARNNLCRAGRRRGEQISQFSKDEAAAQKDSETERDVVHTRKK